MDRVVMAIPRDLAPYHAGVFPLVNKDGLYEIASDVSDKLTDAGFYVTFDDKGSIGRRYARADEAGVPLAVTIDYQTKGDSTVTVRDRDTWQQRRLKTDDLPAYIAAYLHTAP